MKRRKNKKRNKIVKYYGDPYVESEECYRKYEEGNETIGGGFGG